MTCRRENRPEHARARRWAQEAAVRGLVASAVVEMHAAHAAALHDPAGSARDFLGEAALSAVRALNGAGDLTLLPAMHRVMNAVCAVLVDSEAALYGYWMKWRLSNQLGWPLSTGDALRLTSEGSATSLHSSAPALLHALRTRLSMEAASYMNQARGTYPGEMSELDAALGLLHPPDEELEVGEVRIFVEGAGEIPPNPRSTHPLYDGRRPTPPYAVVCDAFPLEPTWCPALPLATHAPRSWGHPHLSPPFCGTRGALHRGQVLWQERPGSPLLLLVVATRENPERVFGATPTHLYWAALLPRPPLLAPEARDGVHAFLRTKEVTPGTGVRLVWLPRASPNDPRGPRALSFTLDWELWCSVWAEWLARLPPQCRWMTIGP